MTQQKPLSRQEQQQEENSPKCKYTHGWPINKQPYTFACEIASLTPPPSADMATRRRLAVNYSHRSSCLRNLWSAPLSVKSPFKGLRTGRRRRKKVASTMGTETKSTSRGCRCISALAQKVASASGWKGPDKKQPLQQWWGKKRTRNAEKNLTSCRISASSLESHSASTATETFPFQHLHLYPVEREGVFFFFVVFNISRAKSSYGFCSR